MDFATILPIDEMVIEKTIIIRQNKKIGLGNAIIAATALTHNLTLLSRNKKDFSAIPGLNIIIPYSF